VVTAQWFSRPSPTVPGMVGATATHLQSLRRMVDDGWIRTLIWPAGHVVRSGGLARPQQVRVADPSA
jgi:hypothetical protein